MSFESCAMYNIQKLKTSERALCRTNLALINLKSRFACGGGNVFLPDSYDMQCYIRDNVNISNILTAFFADVSYGLTHSLCFSVVHLQGVDYFCWFITSSPVSFLIRFWCRNRRRISNSAIFRGSATNGRDWQRITLPLSWMWNWRWNTSLYHYDYMTLWYIEAWWTVQRCSYFLHRYYVTHSDRKLLNHEIRSKATMASAQIDCEPVSSVQSVPVQNVATYRLHRR